MIRHQTKIGRGLPMDRYELIKVPSDHALRTWEFVSGKYGHRLKEGIQSNRIDRISLNDNTLVITTYGKRGLTRVFNLRTGLPAGNDLKNDSIMKPRCFLANEGDYIIRYSPDHDVFEIIDNTQTGKLRTLEFPRQCHCYCFSNDSLRFLTVSRINLLQEWDLLTGECIREHRLEHNLTPVKKICITSNGILAAGYDSIVNLYSSDGKSLETYRTPSKCVYLLATSPDERHLVIRGIENKVFFINLLTKRVDKTLACGNDITTVMKFSNNGKTLITYHHERPTATRIWDLEKLSHDKFVSKHVKSPRFIYITGGSTMIVGDKERDDRLQFIDIASDKLLGSFYNFRDGYLWETPSDESESGAGLFWSDIIQKIIDVIEYKNNTTVTITSSAIKESYFLHHLDQFSVMARINNRWADYQSMRQDYLNYKQIAIQDINSDLLKFLPDTMQGGKV